MSKGLPQSPNQSRPTGNWARGERCLAVRECEKITERETERKKGEREKAMISFAVKLKE